MPRNLLTEPSDEELACRAQQGCADSFERLLRRFQTPVLHFLRHRGAGADAEDLLQETFVRAYTNLHRYRRRWRFATWLFTIARRISINYHRRSRPTADGKAVESAVSNRPGPEQTVAAEEDRLLLWDTAAKVLSEAEMTAVWLYYIEDMPVREIAAVLERSWVATKTMLFRARRKLLPRLAALEADGSLPSTATAARSSGDCRGVEGEHVEANSLP